MIFIKASEIQQGTFTQPIPVSSWPLSSDIVLNIRLTEYVSKFTRYSNIYLCTIFLFMTLKNISLTSTYLSLQMYVMQLLKNKTPENILISEGWSVFYDF